jgi:VWFA-related protein
LTAGLQQIGTQAPGSGGDETAEADNRDSRSSTSGTGNGGNSPSGGNGGYGPYGRRSGYPGGGGNSGNNGGGGHERGLGARGGTVLYDALFLASDEVLARQKGRRALVVLTDGVDRHSKESLTEAIEAAQRADTVIYAIFYKGREEGRGFNNYPGGYPGGYGGYDPYGRYPPTTGGSTDPGTYKDPDGKKILQRICEETGGRTYELKGKGSVDEIYRQIGDELRAQYRLGFTPNFEAGGKGFHTIQVTLTNPANKRLEIQTRNGYYASDKGSR